MPISIDDEEVTAISVDGDRIIEVTKDGDLVWGEPATFSWTFDQPFR